MDGTDKYYPLIQQTLDGWRNEDGPVEKKMPVEADIPEWIERESLREEASENEKAVSDLIVMAFFFLLRVGEYTVKSGRNNTKRTVQFRIKDVTFFKKGEDGTLRQLRRNASAEEILAADAVTLKLENQKNGWKGVCISHHSTGSELMNPCRAVARRYLHIRENCSDPNCFLSAYFVDGKRADVTDKEISTALKVAAAVLDYPNSRGIPLASIDTHSLRIGGANALSLAGYTDRQIKKMGRWRGETFLEYIRESLSDFSAGMAESMTKCFGFVSLEAGVYSDVTERVVEADYNDNVSAGAA